MSLSLDEEEHKPQINIFRKIQGTELYAFTVKILKNPKVADQVSYEPFLKNLYSLSSVLCICGELDSRKVLHYHGVIRITTGFYRKNLIVKNFHLYLRKVFDVNGWVDYCFKNDIYHCFESIKLALPQIAWANSKK